MQLAESLGEELVGRNRIRFEYDACSGGSSDFGDVTLVMPGIQLNVAGAAGTAHGIDYHIEDPEKMCLNMIKIHLFLIDALLSQNAEKAQWILSEYKPKYPSIDAYLKALDDFFLDKDAVQYDNQGNVNIDYRK